MNSKTAQDWIDELALARHPEGGWFRRVYESKQISENGGPIMTSIYYLLEGHDFSAFHRLKQDEQWHFYAGAPLTIHSIHPPGNTAECYTISSEGPFQATIPAGTFFGATVDGPYALVGCTVAPGFNEADFELPAQATLLHQFPNHKALIQKLTRN